MSKRNIFFGIIILIIIIILFSGIFLFLRKSPPPPQKTTEKEAQQLIPRDASLFFNPSSLSSDAKSANLILDQGSYDLSEIIIELSYTPSDFKSLSVMVDEYKNQPYFITENTSDHSKGIIRISMVKNPSYVGKLQSTPIRVAQIGFSVSNPEKDTTLSFTPRTALYTNADLAQNTSAPKPKNPVKTSILSSVTPLFIMKTK